MSPAATGLPDGFGLLRRPPVTLIARNDALDLLLRAGWTDSRSLEKELAGGAHPAGRGRTTIVRLDGRAPLVLKQMRRGGWLGSLWRDRYPGRSRLLDNLRVPAEALRRGVPTPAPVALVLVEGPRGLYRAWLAVEEVVGAQNLIERLRAKDSPSAAEIDAVVGAVRRMHDRGVEHRDLNLGNLLVRRAPAGDFQPFVIDLDRARLWDSELPLGARIRSLRRLERSTVKLFGERPPGAFDLRRRWYEAYAADDADLARRLDRARRANRLWIRLHRPGWRQV